MLFCNEAYVGKTKDLLEAEIMLDTFRNKHIGSYLINFGINSDPDLIKFDRKMEDIFGFGCFTLHVNNVAEMNAYTMPIDYRYDVVNNGHDTIIDKGHFKFKKDADYALLLCIYSGIIFNPDFTTSEVMAIILHEVGHNFNSALSSSNGIFINLYKVLLACTQFMYMDVTGAIMNTNAYRKFIDRTGRSLREDGSFLIPIYDTMVQIKSLGLSFINGFGRIINILTLGTCNIEFAVLNGLRTMSYYINKPFEAILKLVFKKPSYTSEEIADNFATIYGYGADLSSAIGKLGSAKSTPSAIMKAFNNVPLLPALMNINTMGAIIILSIFDEHPTEILRCKDQIDLLERELDKDDIDPKMKKYIKLDIDAINEAIDELIDTTKGLSDVDYGKKLYNKIVYNTNIGTFKKSIYGGKHRFEEYDKAFEIANKNK